MSNSKLEVLTPSNSPTVITAVGTLGFSGHTYPELPEVFPEHPLLERSSMNSRSDQKVRGGRVRAGQ